MTRTGQSLCPSPEDYGGVAGYCAGDGVVTICPAGVFGNTSGLSTPACSGDCAAGFYCPPGSWNNSAHACGGANAYVQCKSKGGGGVLRCCSLRDWLFCGIVWCTQVLSCSIRGCSSRAVRVLLCT